jgi:hypothetical protein
MLNYAIALDRVRSALAMNREDFLDFIQVPTNHLADVRRGRRLFSEEEIKSILSKIKIHAKEFEQLAGTRNPKLLGVTEGDESPLYRLIRLQCEVREKLGFPLEVYRG